MTKLEGVCAVVVTYNRKALLRDCVAALLVQSHPLAGIWIINNLSSDGTAEMLREEFPPERFPGVKVITLAKNVGGAGGFHEGIKQAAAAGANWLWLMDDDTQPRPDTLAELVIARERFPEGKRPDLLSSKAIWRDGSLHLMNQPWAKCTDTEQNFRAAEFGTFPLRTATFVSLLMHRRFVEKFGLPQADYFLGGDDVEYTARILRENFGVAVPSSVVLHNTPQNESAHEGPAWKFGYYVRNTIWMLLWSAALSPWEKTKLFGRFAHSLFAYARRSNFGGESLQAIGRGLWNGIASRPQR